MSENAYVNTDRELWREIKGDYYSPSIHVTADGLIGLNVGGMVIVQDVRKWHKLAEDEYCEIKETPDIHDLLANLARRVSLIENFIESQQRLNDSHSEQIDTLFRNGEKLAEELASVKHLTESNEGDIPTLDERTQPKETPFFSTYTPNIYFNFDAKGETAEEIAQRIIKSLYGGERR